MKFGSIILAKEREGEREKYRGRYSKREGVCE